MERDSLDFGSGKIPVLFRKMFFPTLLGMLSMAALTAIDGIFVGQGVGANGIAAVNIVAPLFMIFTGLGLMFGVGCNVVAAVHLSEGNVKAARINITQAFAAATLIAIAVSVPILIFPVGFGQLFGASATLMPWVCDYAVGIVPGMTFGLWASIGLFVIRLDGSPQYAMMANVVASAINIVLDWVCIFPLGMGVMGAAVATSASMMIGSGIVVYYLLCKADKLKLYRLKLSATSLRLSFRNLWYQSKIGFSALLGEFTLAIFVLLGNIVFMQYLGDDGVGAFGIACYYLPFIFMFGNAIAQSAQPIISYNKEASHDRALMVQRYALRTALLCGILITALFAFMAHPLVTLFLDASTPAAMLAIEGFPLFASGFTIFILNLTCIGYYQSMEMIRPATAYALLRGIVFLAPAFFIIPRWLGIPGIWLSMPVAEVATLVVIGCCWRYNRSNHLKGSK